MWFIAKAGWWWSCWWSQSLRPGGRQNRVVRRRFPANEIELIHLVHVRRSDEHFRLPVICLQSERLCTQDGHSLDSLFGRLSQLLTRILRYNVTLASFDHSLDAVARTNKVPSS